jgi:NAD+ diphosphatase
MNRDHAYTAGSVQAWVEAAPYGGLGLDRALDKRDDLGWVAARAADPSGRVRPLWRDQCLVVGDAPTPLVLPSSAIGGMDPAGLVLLGLDDGVPEFAVDLSELECGDALKLAGADGMADIRTLFPGLPAAQSAAWAYARGLLYWHRHQRYCSRCGRATEARNAGQLRACTGDTCGMPLFPRIEPAVITLVETTTSPRRCLMAQPRASNIEGYSLFAGFVEIAESLEEAVRREMLEEVGVALSSVRYVGSQSWPFPAGGLMIGFRATAEDQPVSVDGNEILEARWFTRDELRQYAEATDRLGRIDSIDRIMLTTWLAEGRTDDI